MLLMCVSVCVCMLVFEKLNTQINVEDDIRKEKLTLLNTFEGSVLRACTHRSQ